MSKLTKCKSCEKEISSNAKSCPGCGAKNSKPFYKKAWFWVLAIIIVAGIGGAGTSEPEVVSKGEGATTETPTTQEEETNTTVETFKIGDTVELDDFRITVNGVRTSEGGQFMKPKEGNEYFYVDATVENISSEEKSVSSMLMFKVVDQDGRSMDMAIVEDANGQLDGKVGAGRKISGEYIVEVPTETTGLELQFDSSLVGKQIVVKLN